MENTTSEPEVVAPGDSKQSYKPPLIRYGEYTAHIPGDKYGKKLRHAGNISHTEDFMRAQNFPRFSDDDFSFEDEEKAQRLRKLLVTIKISFLNGVVSSYADFNLLHDTREEKTVDFSADSLSLRVTQLRKVAYTNQVSYYTTNRASKVDIASNEKMKTIETAIGRDVQTLLMARVMGLADLYPGEKSSLPSELTRSKTGEQYKALRANATRSFWLDYNRDERKILRKEAQNWPSECRANVRKIQKEDLSVVEDDFFQHKKDWMAASDPNIYPCVDKDIYLVLDKDGNPILCSVSQLFQRLFGEAKMHKVVDAVKKWSELPPLPEPNTTRNMANEMIRRDHPELNMELAKSPEELMQRAACLVHYGTWSMPGPMNPDTVYLTADTLLQMGGTEKATPNFAAEAMPSFRRGVLGLSSELVRFILRSIAPEEYKDYVEIFEALPNEKRISLSHPNFFTMAELGINTFTGRHRDRTDTKNGLAGLVPLGTYTGGNLCFPQLGVKLANKPGDCVLFRSAELEHFVDDWHGYRISLKFANYQPVTNYAHRRLGRKPALPCDPWYKGEPGSESASAGAAGDEEQYDPCIVDDLDFEEAPEGGWTPEQVHGAGTWSRDKNTPGYQSGSNDSSEVDDDDS